MRAASACTANAPRSEDDPFNGCRAPPVHRPLCRRGSRWRRIGRARHRGVWSHVKAIAAFLVLAVGLCALSHGLATQVPTALRDWVAWPLAPGIALYVVAGGSLLFGSAQGGLGDPWLIVTVSALAWTLLLAAARWVWRAVRRKAFFEG